jgi:hypothetical protein
MGSAPAGMSDGRGGYSELPSTPYRDKATGGHPIDRNLSDPSGTRHPKDVRDASIGTDGQWPETETTKIGGPDPVMQAADAAERMVEQNLCASTGRPIEDETLGVSGNDVRLRMFQAQKF